ncbi:tyrosine-type recombinase/integrase [Haloplanus sp. C73]|uniref:tyrosine-type recombinase/integrase n=1 Tax=Haloplanus sp. C73 TaxID=3421641 RepID=UPI003EBBA743
MSKSQRPDGGAPDLSVRQAVDRWLGRLRLDRSDQTVSSYRRRLKHFVEWCEDEGFEHVDELTAWDLDEYDTHRRKTGIKAISLNNELTTLRLFLDYCERVGLTEADLSDSIDPPTVDSGEETDDEFFAPDDARRLLDAYRSGDDRYTREHAVFELVWWTGARKGGLCALDLDDVNLEEGYVHFHHRPDSGTPLKNGSDGERIVGISEDVVDALRGYIDENRPTVTDDYGREPLFASRQGRCHVSTLTQSVYFGTLPCRWGPCPHDRERETCEFYSRTNGFRCPSSTSPHPVRSGSIMWQLNRGLRADHVSDRVNATTDVIDRYYDKVTQLDEFRKRREGDISKLGFDSQEDDK